MKPLMLKPNRAGLKPLFCVLIILILFFGATASPATAKVTGWEVSPENPKIGDTLIISGLATPEEEVEVSVSFEKTVPVYLREYTYEFENIEILNFNNLFTVRAEGVENLKVKMKMVISKTESAWADGGIATVSHSGVSPGEYRVRVDGIAEDGASGVNLKVTTVQKLNAGKDGKFSYRYSTGSVPSGKLEIKLGNSEREIIFDAKGNVPVLQAPPASSQIRASGEPEERKNSEMALAGKESTDTELTDRENEEKRSIYLTESSWDEDNTIAATAGEVPSKESVKESAKESAKEQEIQEHENQVIDYFYLLAGILAGFGVLLVGRMKK
ncbi:hypothetical protein [Methanosarcina sp. 2.H.A.1B.4]|uniref:hypothetical protein n=1 Tax=Methanosarcina sp. 2.H.A.1B.4 TaxID=1483600 RepID=UPI000621D6AD|nr:hypothetical protein [Methanosarcina sp. 2.H.A.1B.4]KKG07506.1 hypothetical protein EO92_07485 [Methanosarcina sp. 2.H.A.1B.4]